uniref:ERAP1_C domain-containing protein n=1 Tax=Haemonchus placei TaxID=6290 RepID=A0A0N4XBQ9_HAEPC
LSAVKDDSELIEVINALDTAESFDSLTGSNLIDHLVGRLSHEGVAKWIQSFDSLTGSNLIDHLVGRLSHEGVAKWIQTANKPWSFRHICAAFPHWSNEAKVEALTNLLQRPRAQEVQYAVGNCIDSMFKMKAPLCAPWTFGYIKSDHLIKKEIGRSFSALQTFWICLKLWSKMASSDEMSEGYVSNAEELIMIAQGDEDSLKVIITLLVSSIVNY